MQLVCRFTNKTGRNRVVKLNENKRLKGERNGNYRGEKRTKIKRMLY